MTATPATSAPAQKPLIGRVRIPGDKSISHRALILGAMAVGTTRISGLLEGADVLATAAAMAALGCPTHRDENGIWHVEGRGVGGFVTPNAPLDFGNSGTGARLVMGAVASSTARADFIGDASLTRRPMARVTKPLAMMGVDIRAGEGDKLPLTICGNGAGFAIEYAPDIASAQVKSAILLAGLGAAGDTCVIENIPTRDHTENMIRQFNGVCDTQIMADGRHRITVRGEADLRATEIAVPGDPSSAAFLLIAALLIPDSDVTIENVMLNPHRDGLIRALQKMGGNISLHNQRQAAGEKLADLRVRASKLTAIRLGAADAPSMIDEYPALAIAAACAKGRSHFGGLAELRVKESDRLAAIADGLRVNGISVAAGEDTLSIEGGRVEGGGCVATHHDHRIAMSFLVLGLVAQRAVRVDDTQMIATSFPEFFQLMRALGAEIDEMAA